MEETYEEYCAWCREDNECTPLSHEAWVEACKNEVTVTVVKAVRARTDSMAIGRVLEAAQHVVNDHDMRCGCCTEGPHCPNCRLGYLLRKLDKA